MADVRQNLRELNEKRDELRDQNAKILSDLQAVQDVIASNEAKAAALSAESQTLLEKISEVEEVWLCPALLILRQTKYA